MPDGNGSAPWFVHLPPQATESVRLFTFGHAGSGCATFAETAKLLAGSAEVWSVNLPGRQARFSEPARTELGPLVEELADAIEPMTDKPYAVLGYCAGALVGYAVLAELGRRGLPRAEVFLPASYLPPPLGRPLAQALTAMSSDDFWEELIGLGGVPPQLAAPAYRSIFEPGLRGDYALVATYADDVASIDVPITVVAGRLDPVLKPEELAGWNARTTAAFDLAVIESGHWILDEGLPMLVDVVRKSIGRQVGGVGSP
jgi:surfactin synthase thioesterase subunit